MSDTDEPIVPQDDDGKTDGEETDFNKLLDEHTANGRATPHEEDAEPGHWHKNKYALPAFLQRPPKQWTVDTVFGERDFVLLYGESGHGKTHVALDLAFSCATGRTFAGVFTVKRPLSVAYCTGEGTGGLADRLRAVSSFYGTTDVSMYIFPDIPQLFQSTQSNGALAFGTEWQAMARDGLVPAQLDVLMLDTFHNATAGADENSAKDAGIVQASMRWLRDTLGCTIVLIHHAGKSGATERGSSAIRASADTVLRATKVGNGYTLACEKLKDGDTWPAQAFSLVCPPGMPDSVRVSWDGDVKTGSAGDKTREQRLLAYMDEHAGITYTADELAQAINDQSSIAVHSALKRLRDAGSVQSAKEKRTIKDGRQRDVWLYWRDGN